MHVLQSATSYSFKASKHGWEDLWCNSSFKPDNIQKFIVPCRHCHRKFPWLRWKWKKKKFYMKGQESLDIIHYTWRWIFVYLFGCLLSSSDDMRLVTLSGILEISTLNWTVTHYKLTTRQMNCRLMKVMANQ